MGATKTRATLGMETALCVCVNPHVPHLQLLLVI